MIRKKIMSREPRESKITREPRAVETRNYDGRDVDLRPMSNFLNNIIFNVPENAKKEGYSYCYMVYREDDENSLLELDRAENERGFYPALRSEHPLLARYGKSSFTQSKNSDDFIRRGEQVLMMRPTALKIQEEEEIQAITERKMNLVDSMSGDSRVVYSNINYGRNKHF